MSLFNTIRSLFGFKAEVEKSQQPIDQLDDITSQLSDKKSELVKAQREFDEINSELTLKLKACDKLIEKGVKEGEFNKNVIQQRLDKITDEFLTNIQTLSKQVSELEKEKIQVEGDILAKAIDLTSRLTKAEQQEINDIIVTWKEIGLIKGQEIKSHTRAIVTALDEIVKGGPGSGRHKSIHGIEFHDKTPPRTYQGKEVSIFDKKGSERGASKGDIQAIVSQSEEMKKYGIEESDSIKDIVKKLKENNVDKIAIYKEGHVFIAKKISEETDIKKSHEPIAIELAGKGDVIYDSPVEGHYANAIVCKYIEGEKYILFLKRATDKALEPGKWCLPGGHIDEGETIEQAACRELKEEANIDATGGYVRGKAKCDDGKWAFYVEISPDNHNLALLDGESENATWMCREEWIEADLIFDLKDHLVAMESRSVNIKDIPDIMNPDTLKKSEDDSDLEKGGFHSQKPHHKYVRREGSPGNYTYYYDSPDTKERDGKKYREGLYSSNVAPLSGVRYEKVQDELDGIVDGAGWATDDYIMNFSEGLTKKEKYALMYQLAKKGILYNEEEIDEDEAIRGDIPKKGKMTTKDVDFIYGKFIKKSIDINNPFYYDTEADLIKGRAAAEGEERTWGGKRYKKQGGKWMPVGSGKGYAKHTVTVTKDNAVSGEKPGQYHYHARSQYEAEGMHMRKYGKEGAKGGDPDSHNKEFEAKHGEQKKEKPEKKLSTKQLKEHVENTSTEQLKKVAENKDHPYNDAAKRELERRGGEKKGEGKDKDSLSLPKAHSQAWFEKNKNEIKKRLESYISENLSTSEAAEALGYDEEEAEEADDTIYGDLAQEWAGDYNSFKDHVDQFEDIFDKK